MKKFELSIDHPMMTSAKKCFDICLKKAIEKAITTESLEGSITLKVSFEIMQMRNDDGEISKRMPLIKFKVGYAVPMKESVEATIEENSRLEPGSDGWLLVNGQVSMDEIMEEE